VVAVVVVVVIVCCRRRYCCFGHRGEVTCTLARCVAKRLIPFEWNMRKDWEGGGWEWELCMLLMLLMHWWHGIKYRPRPRNVMMESWNHGLSNTLTKKQRVERGYALLAAGSRVGTRESVRACESEKIVCVCLSMASPAELTSSTCHLHCSTYGTHYLGTVFAVNPTTTASTFDIAQLLQTGTCIFIEHHNPRSTATTTRVQGGG